MGVWKDGEGDWWFIQLTAVFRLLFRTFFPCSCSAAVLSLNGLLKTVNVANLHRRCKISLCSFVMSRSIRTPRSLFHRLKISFHHHHPLEHLHHEVVFPSILPCLTSIWFFLASTLDLSIHPNPESSSNSFFNPDPQPPLLAFFSLLLELHFSSSFLPSPSRRSSVWPGWMGAV